MRTEKIKPGKHAFVSTCQTAFARYGIDGKAVENELPSRSSLLDSYETLHKAFVRAAGGRKLRVLELWHGYSGYPVVLAHLGHKVTAVDPLAMRAELKKCESVRWHKASELEEFRPGNRFNAIVIRNMLWGPSDFGTLVLKMDQMTHPGGFHIQEFAVPGARMNLELWEGNYREMGYEVKRIENKTAPRQFILLARKPLRPNRLAIWLGALLKSKGK